jgi:hypothetical protein
MRSDADLNPSALTVKYLIHRIARHQRKSEQPVFNELVIEDLTS